MNGVPASDITQISMELEPIKNKDSNIESSARNSINILQQLQQKIVSLQSQQQKQTEEFNDLQLKYTNQTNELK